MVVANDKPTEKWLPTAAAAAHISANPETLNRWAREGRIPCARIGSGSHRRFRLSDLDAWLQKNSQPVAGAAK